MSTRSIQLNALEAHELSAEKARKHADLHDNAFGIRVAPLIKLTQHEKRISIYTMVRPDINAESSQPVVARLIAVPISFVIGWSAPKHLIASCSAYLSWSRATESHPRC